MEWSKVVKNSPLYLNLGGAGDCHPKPHYENYIAVDLNGDAEWSVKHDLSQPFPLPDSSVDRILSEHFFEHMAEVDVAALLKECYRVLKPGGFLRIAVPDYMNPRKRKYLKAKHDPDHTNHLSFPTYESLSSQVSGSPFEGYQFYHYWHGDNFVRKPIDYSVGYLKRTPDHDRRNFRRGLAQKLIGRIRDGLFLLSRGFIVRKIDLLTQRGHPLRMTSIVVDLFKQ
jgi:SAM-dependent methyltransferase